LKPFTDPITGDHLSPLEYYTRQVQVAVRTPWFILGFNVVTLGAFITGHLDIWNYFASWLAIIVEWLVGTYMFGQTGRDAVHIRRIDRVETLILQLLEAQNGVHEQPVLHAPTGEECAEPHADE
jgi:hypothetical protein